jgi:Icc-related predicted phosphoesterase
MRIAAVADLHVPRFPIVSVHSLVDRIDEIADVLLLCGDLTDRGTEDEARMLAKELAASVRIPIIGVLGNHDFESGRAPDVAAILAEVGVKILDGDGVEVGGVGFAGVKGFAGGFGQRALQPWGEPTIKAFVHEAVNEALKLESALAKLRTSTRVAVLHYAPVEGTVAGEPVEIFPFLGSSRLEEPLGRYAVNAVFHGHAHGGSAEGRTRDGSPVYNVALPLLQRLTPERPLRVVDVPVAQPVAA